MPELIKNIILWLIFGTFLVVGLSVIYAIIRFSIISPLLTRGEKKRIRKPNVDGIERLVGFVPSTELIDFYTKWPYLKKEEYYLVDTVNLNNWFIGGFIPISKIDTKEWLKVSGRHGLPIANDMNKGIYYVQIDGSIELWSPNVKEGHVIVAKSIKEFMNFKVAEYEDIYPDENE